MNADRKLQLFSLGVIANSAAAIALLSPLQAQADACGARSVCTQLAVCPGAGQVVCDMTLPAGCTSTTVTQCIFLGLQCYNLVFCQDH